MLTPIVYLGAFYMKSPPQSNDLNEDSECRPKCQLFRDTRDTQIFSGPHGHWALILKYLGQNTPAYSTRAEVKRALQMAAAQMDLGMLAEPSSTQHRVDRSIWQTEEGQELQMAYQFRESFKTRLGSITVQRMVLAWRAGAGSRSQL